MAETHDRLLWKITSKSSLTDCETEALRRLPIAVRSFDENSQIVAEGDRPTDAVLVMSGLLASYKTTAAGVRQITAFHIPGDLPDLKSFPLHQLDFGLCALTPATVGHIPHAALAELTRQFPGVATALWRDTLIEAASLREWVLNLGARAAPARIAHIFCELYVRYQAAGLARPDAIDLPLSQAELGEAAGLSTVHVNRVLKELRDAELVSLRRGLLKILDWARLQQAADFDPAYLHLQRDD